MTYQFCNASSRNMKQQCKRKIDCRRRVNETAKNFCTVLSVALQPQQTFLFLFRREKQINFCLCSFFYCKITDVFCVCLASVQSTSVRFSKVRCLSTKYMASVTFVQLIIKAIDREQILVCEKKQEQTRDKVMNMTKVKKIIMQNILKI